MMRITVVLFLVVMISITPLFVYSQDEVEEEVEEEVEAEVKEVGGEKVIEFGEMLIRGRIDRPILLTTARTNPRFEKITFERSFMDDILRPIDKEEFEKRVKTTKFDAVRRPLVWISTTTAIVSGSVGGYMFSQEEMGSGKMFAITAGISGGVALILWLATD